MAIIAASACGDRKHFKKNVEYPFYIPHTLNEIVDQIAAYPSFDEKFIGLANSLSMQYARFERMNEIATDKQLMQLTNHSSSNVRSYALRALAERHYDGIVPLLKSKIGNTSTLQYSSGCLTINQAAGDYYRSLLISEKAYQYERTLPKL